MKKKNLTKIKKNINIKKNTAYNRFDRQNIWMWLQIYMFALVLFIGLLIYAYQSIESKKIGYQLEKKISQKNRLIKTRERTEAKLSSLQDLARLAELAKEKNLGLSPMKFPVVVIDSSIYR